MVLVTGEERVSAVGMAGAARARLRYELRRAVVMAVKSGRPIVQVAADHDVAVRSVYDWVRCHRLGGWDALKEGHRDGRPRKVGFSAEEWLMREIVRGNSTALWSLDRVMAGLKRDCGITVSKNTAHRLLKRAGLDPAGSDDWKAWRSTGETGRTTKGADAQFVFLESRRVPSGHEGVERLMTSVRTRRGDIFFRVDQGGDAAAHLPAVVKLLRGMWDKPLVVVIRGDLGRYRRSIMAMMRSRGTPLTVLEWGGGCQIRRPGKVVGRGTVARRAA